MPTVLIKLTGGAGVVRRDDGEIVITRDVSDDQGQPLRGPSDYRPAQMGLDTVRSIVAGPLPPRATSAEVVDDPGTRVAATVGGGVYAAILEQSNHGHGLVVCCRDTSGAPVPRPLPADWTRTAVPDAQERCPGCGAVANGESGALRRRDSAFARETSRPYRPERISRIRLPSAPMSSARPRCSWQSGARLG